MLRRNRQRAFGQRLLQPHKLIMRRERNFIGPAGMGGIVGLWSASSLIRSIQAGTMTAVYPANATGTIAAVDTANSIVYLLGLTQSNANNNYAVATGGVELTNSTTVTGYQSISGGADMVFSFVVVEYHPGIVKSIQAGTIAVGGGASATATVTAVNTAKSMLVWRGFKMSTGAAPNTDAWATKTVLTNATTVTANRVTADALNNITAYFGLVEFF